LDADAFEEQYRVPKPTKDSDIIFNCRGGVRSLTAIEIANRLGYSRFVTKVFFI
jgi:rhodanese-related sulfurtransferase